MAAVIAWPNCHINALVASKAVRHGNQESHGGEPIPKLFMAQGFQTVTTMQINEHSR